MVTKDRVKLLRTQTKYRLNNKEKVAESNRVWRCTAKGRFANLKKGAKKRNKNMSLSFEEFSFVIKDPCYYCNGFFPPVVSGSGIDRMDNNIGYELSNVVSCCWTCNSIKNEILTVAETQAVIRLIIEMRNGNETGIY